MLVSIDPANLGFAYFIVCSEEYPKIDRACVIASYALGVPVKPIEEFFITYLDNAFGKLPQEWGWHDRVLYNKIGTGLDNDSFSRRLLALGSVKPEKREVVERAAGLLREAFDVENPLISLMFSFSSLSAILKDGDSSKHIRISDLKEVLRPWAKNMPFSILNDESFSTIFESLYGDLTGRCGVEHGIISITDHRMQIEARQWGRTLPVWILNILDDYTRKNQVETAVTQK